MVTTKILLTLTANHNYILIQFDNNNDFLHGDTFEEDYVDLPYVYISKRGSFTSKTKN